MTTKQNSRGVYQWLKSNCDSPGMEICTYQMNKTSSFDNDLIKIQRLPGKDSRSSHC